MTTANFPKPTEAELQILQILWKEGPSSVRQVNDKLNELREVGYTTTLKLMQIMAEKGLASRDTNSRTHVYSSAVVEKDMRKRLLDQFVHSTFRGSAMDLVMQALGNHKASSQELDQIKDLIRKIEEDNS